MKLLALVEWSRIPWRKYLQELIIPRTIQKGTPKNYSRDISQEKSYKLPAEKFLNQFWVNLGWNYLEIFRLIYLTFQFWRFLEESYSEFIWYKFFGNYSNKFDLFYGFRILFLKSFVGYPWELGVKIHRIFVKTSL